MCVQCAYIPAMATLALTKRPRDDRFFARISAEDKRLFRRAAAATGLSAAAFVIERAREAARQLLAAPPVIRLDARESRRLMAALLAPPRKATVAFRRALRAYRSGVRSDVNPHLPKARRS